ncbi:MAG: 1-phosphofructokinase family hexose kinase [Candidatus Caldatribacteriaceae bacterium]
MIYTFCPNPALDRILILPHLEFDEVNRVEEVYETPAGKGVNVARAIQNVGGKAKLLLFLGGSVGRKIKDGLQREGFDFIFWEALGESRVTTILHEKDTARHTVLNEPGPLVSVAQAVECYQFLENSLQSRDYLILSGSLPRGIRVDFYAQLITLASGKGARSVVDSSGEFFRRAFIFSPFMVKPNVKEAEEALGFPIQSWEEKRKAVETFLHKGVELVILSDGPRGLVVGWRDRFWKVSVTERIQGKYFIGSGDTLVGVVIQELTCGKGIEEALRFGTACGLANTLRPGAGTFELKEAQKLQELVLVEELR